MKNGKNNFKETFYPWILNLFAPTCLVFSSPSSQKILGKNFLSPSQFMRPFGDLSGTSLVFMFNEKYQNIISDFKFDFYDPQDFTKIENNQVNNYIINCLSSENVMPTYENNFIKLNKNDIKSFLGQLNQYSPKYYLEFEQLFFEICKFQETELYQQPLLYIYLCDINDDVNIITNIISESMPRLIKSGAYEKKIFDLLILLNDKSDKVNQNLNKLVLETNFKNKYYDKEVITIDINSGSIKQFQNDLSEDIWSKYIHKVEEYSDGFDPIERGRYITKTEVNIFRQKFVNYIKNKFRINLMDLINQLDKNLSKSGGINLLFNKLKPTKIETKELIVDYRIQKLSSIDKQRYLLSILLFHIRDYVDAYENLKKLADSIKGKNKDYENAIRQFIIICRYMKKEDKLKIEILAPFQTYVENNQYLLAYRNILLYLKMTEQIKVKYIAENIYKYNNFLSNHYIKYISGLLYEKVAFYYFISRKPKPRKFAFDIINYSTQQYSLEKENDIKNYYLIQNFGYILDLFKIDLDYSLYDKSDYLNTFYFIKKYIFKTLCSACEMVNNIKLGVTIFWNYLIFLLDENSNETKNLNNIFNDKKNDEISVFFQKFNSLLIKGKISQLENFPLPIIYDDSLVYYTEQDQKILKENGKFYLSFVQSFNKYTELSIEQKYSSLSENNISSLRFLDEQLSRTFVSNYYMKREVNVKEHEVIFIRFNLKNPLNINLSVNNLTLIINRIPENNLINNTDNKCDYICGLYNIDIPANQILPVGMKISFNTNGLYEIIGLNMTLFKNFNVKYLFNKKKINSLYLHCKRYKENNNSNLRKGNFKFRVINAVNAINVILNNNNDKVILFQNQILYIPLKINNNNNNIEIKKYTVFLESNDDLIIYPKYLHNNYLGDNNNSILIPIIGNKIGECRLKIIIKFEEKLNNANLDLYRNVILIKVYQGINLNIEDKIYELNELNYKRKIKLNMDIINQINIHTILFSRTKSLIYDKEKYVIQELDKQNEYIDEYKDKNINQNIIIEYINKEKSKDNYYDNLFENIIEIKDIENYANIKDFFKDIFYGENNLLIKYKLNLLENNKMYNINCLYKHEIKINDKPPEQKFYIDKSYLKNNLKKSFNINYKVEDLCEKQKYININIKILDNNEYFEKIKQIIEYIEIKVKTNNNNFDWIGVHSTLFNNFNQIQNEKNAIKTFFCLIDEKSFSFNDKNGNINLNQFEFFVKIKNSNLIYQFDEFPYDIYFRLN